MNTPPQLSDAITRVIEHPTGGVLGLVDELLALCPEQGLRLEWQGDHCHIQTFEKDLATAFDVSLRKSVFRAILARFAALCNERMANSVSPYGGHGSFSIATNPAKLFRIAFANTTGEQKLEVKHSGVSPMQTITATFEDGVLKPTQPLDLPAHAEVRLTIELLPAPRLTG